MTSDQALAMVARLMAAWPGPELGDDTVDLWLKELARVELPDAVEVVDQFIRHEQRFPAIATFHAALRNHRRRESLGRSQPELPSDDPLVPAERAREFFAQTRSLLRGAP